MTLNQRDAYLPSQWQRLCFWIDPGMAHQSRLPWITRFWDSPFRSREAKRLRSTARTIRKHSSWFHVLRLLAPGKAMQPMQPVPNVLVGQSEIHTVIDCLGKSAKQEQQNPFQKSEANFLWRMSTPDLWTLTLTALSINWGGPQNSDTVLSKNRTASPAGWINCWQHTTSKTWVYK